MLWSNTAIGALRTGQVLHICYNGYDRLVEVHAVGFTFAGHSLMRGWQVGGACATGLATVGWQLLRLDEALSAHITNTPSEAPRPGYRRGDKAMVIIAQL